MSQQGLSARELNRLPGIRVRTGWRAKSRLWRLWLTDARYRRAADGAVVLDGVAAVPWADSAGDHGTRAYRMTRACYCASIEVREGVTLETRGRAVYCRGPVVVAGTIL